ncbi:MAG: hypothetical protein M0Z99_21105 [Betaproteobacteria bacterium]|nr:hypothetical protein [Betaproteobacteria bacterium]
MGPLQKPLTVRFSTEEFAFLSDLAESHGVSVNGAVRLVVQAALSDGRDSHRLAALEGRLDRFAADTNRRLDDLLEKLALIATAISENEHEHA